MSESSKTSKPSSTSARPSSPYWARNRRTCRRTRTRRCGEAWTSSKRFLEKEINMKQEELEQKAEKQNALINSVDE